MKNKLIKMGLISLAVLGTASSANVVCEGLLWVVNTLDYYELYATSDLVVAFYLEVC